jgi:two-component system phosphate regulon sensor histidine kinase PhoR
VRIAVSDNGRGISKREQKRIFRAYYRSPDAREANVSGVGLGLSLCKQIVAAHGGVMEVESEPGKGSCFSVYLPAAGGDEG